ncbi:hypothetical protein LDENG_00174890 [Lucifuga dentata]|nr:hypothetical protein LDENG_00174890 [Lucifuga dentata]
MKKAAQPKSTVFKCLNNDKRPVKHLKPLSVYSRVVTCDSETSLHHSTNFTSPFINFKVDILNLSFAKRKLNDSGLDDSYETPAKKPRSREAYSPDLGCFVDSYSPLPKNDLTSPLIFFTPESSEATKGVTNPTKESEKSQLHRHCVENKSSEESGDNKQASIPHNVKLKNLKSLWDFDCDVDGILCLKPHGNNAAGGHPDVAESGPCGPVSNAFQNIRDVCHPAQRRSSETGDGKVEEKETYLIGKDEEEDVISRRPTKRTTEQKTTQGMNQKHTQKKLKTQRNHV